MTSYALIDVSNLVYRARYGSQKNSGSSFLPPVDGVEGFEQELRDSLGLCLHTTFLSLSKVWSRFRAQHLIACFDARPWRSVVYPQYKRNRILDVAVATPVEIEKAQVTKDLIGGTLNSMRQFFGDHTNVTVLHHDLCEADDFIARFIQNHTGDHHIVISNDSDYRQLLADNVELYNGVANELTTTGGLFFQDGRRVKTGELSETLHGEAWKRKIDKKSGEPVFVDAGWELFRKVMLGDEGDNVDRCAPAGLGDKKLRPFYQKQEGPTWEGLMDQPAGEGRHVRDLYDRNVELIDLKRQPDEVKTLLDDVIKQAVVKDPKPRIGIAFLGFCKEHRLKKLAESSTAITEMLSAAYPA